MAIDQNKSLLATKFITTRFSEPPTTLDAPSSSIQLRDSPNTDFRSPSLGSANESFNVMQRQDAISYQMRAPNVQESPSCGWMMDTIDVVLMKIQPGNKVCDTRLHP